MAIDRCAFDDFIECTAVFPLAYCGVDRLTEAMLHLQNRGNAFEYSPELTREILLFFLLHFVTIGLLFVLIEM